MKPFTALGKRRFVAALLLVSAVLAFGLWVNRKAVRQRFALRLETRAGILVLQEVPPVFETSGPLRARAIRPGTYCLLVHGYTQSGPTEIDQVEDRFWNSDGLDRGFCDEHEDQIDRRIQVIGIRTSGYAIGQECSNRSCFEAVLLVQ